jgi:uncharacterized metal-binding protein
MGFPATAATILNMADKKTTKLPGSSGRNPSGRTGLKTLSCAECGPRNCHRRDTKYPPFCLTEAAGPQEIMKIVRHLRGDNQDARMARASAEIEGLYYGKATRVEEIILFAKRIGATRIGIATCLGLVEESRTFARICRAKGLEPYSVVCKVGSVDKTEIGLAEEVKLLRGSHEAMCNPMLQARLLNAQKTQLNVVVGLCVGHDSLFIKYSKAPVTTLITKDRVLGHNPAAALYASHSYYKRLLDPKQEL